MGRRSRSGRAVGSKTSNKSKQGKKKEGKSGSGADAVAADDANFDDAAPTIPDADDDGFIRVDPRRVRFQYSRIRPTFSGCGRSVLSTLEAIRNGEVTPDDLPPILVLVGPPVSTESEGGASSGRWYFSLNNRRLWVLKRCREEGLLEGQGNRIRARVREWKSDKERERYTVERCALEAKFMREKSATEKSTRRSADDENDCEEEEEVAGREIGDNGPAPKEDDLREGVCDRKRLHSSRHLDMRDSSDGVDDSEEARSSERITETRESSSDAEHGSSDEDDEGASGVAQTANRFAVCGFDSESSDSSSD